MSLVSVPSSMAGIYLVYRTLYDTIETDFYLPAVRIAHKGTPSSFYTLACLFQYLLMNKGCYIFLHTLLHYIRGRIWHAVNQHFRPENLISVLLRKYNNDRKIIINGKTSLERPVLR